MSRVGDYFKGAASRGVLLTVLLPLCLVLFLGSVGAAAYLAPHGYDWRVEVMSKLTSPSDNPEGYWLPMAGIILAVLLAFPFAGYVGRRLRVDAPRFGWWAELAFKAGFVIVICSMAAQAAQPLIGMRRLHTVLAQAGGVIFGLGMISCGVCAFRDRIGKGRKLLPTGLAYYWCFLIVLPLGLLAGLGILAGLGSMGLDWAENYRQSFRHTPLWHLAFWEWIGGGVIFAFLWGSVYLLPAREREKASAPASRMEANERVEA